VAYTWRRLHHSTSRNYTTEHKLAVPKILNNKEFNPSQKRMSYETLASVTDRILMNNRYKYSINNNLWCILPNASTMFLETNKPLSDRGLGE